MEYDGLDKDLLALDEEETWYTELDYDPLALEFLFDALERSNAQLAALLKSEFEDVIKETIFGYDPVLNISVIDNEPQFTIIRDDGQGNYIRLDLDNTLAYELNIDQNGNTIEYFELRLNSATPIGNHINIKQSN